MCSIGYCMHIRLAIYDETYQLGDVTHRLNLIIFCTQVRMERNPVAARHISQKSMH